MTTDRPPSSPTRTIGASLGLLVLVGCGQEKETPDAAKGPAASLTGKVMCGYQGWFRAPGDGTEIGWRHYTNPSTGKFEPGHAGIEVWPDMSELGENERFDTPFRHADGSTAQVFSSAVRETVVRHFQWMEDYGIDGVFVQRFGTEVTRGSRRADHPMSRSLDTVLDNCRAGAGAHGRTYAVMYDLSGMKPEALAGLREDWRHLVAGKGILKDAAYQHHAGRPVVAIWGVGFKDREYGPDEVGELIRFLKEDPECGGLTVMLGTSTGWRNGERDASPFAEWERVYALAGIISPWMVGRFRDREGARKYARGRAAGDLQWCEDRGKDFMPVVFPGFSWSNLKKGTDHNPDAYIDRDGGRFLWTQYDALIRETGVSMIYQAMFDELDEATQIFKTSNNPPVGESRFLDNDGLPSDHYLWLVGEATRRLRGEAASTPELPDRHATPRD
ncbi:glycoside hydrolase family 71/99-like protein [Haloferula sp. A504]|uniref:glycoside hydrolase family 71/99-like protein n=1 Tax=Haloferula sp. A504 TaxID=3373601 RepID=UPI0031C1199F|nr:glycoside hydrolase family 71/99-like protein [Verrucomicrobiaceae bacterium E54]